MPCNVDDRVTFSRVQSRPLTAGHTRPLNPIQNPSQPPVHIQCSQSNHMGTQTRTHTDVESHLDKVILKMKNVTSKR